MSTTFSVLERLERWYSAQCDGEWEHSWGLRIETLDNPGWRLSIQLSATALEKRPFASLQIQRNDRDDWMYCKRAGTEFVGACGPENLEEMIGIFLEWAESDRNRDQ